MGILRFLLTVWIAIYHFFPARFETANAAVIIFYFISGYLMRLSYLTFKKRSVTPMRSFYYDRLLRLYPPFLFTFVLTLLLRHLWITPNQSLGWSWWYELLLLPHPYTMFLPGSENAVPPAWSLGLEFHGYFLVPLLMLMSVRGRVELVVLFAIGQVAACFFTLSFSHYWQDCSNYLAADGLCRQPVALVFAYRWFTFGGCSFLLGMLAHESETNRAARPSYYAIILFYLAMFFPYRAYAVPFLHSTNILLTFAFILPLVHGLMKAHIAHPPGRLDRWLGYLSYPLFLTHMLGKAIGEKLFPPASLLVSASLYLAIGMVLALAILLLQQRIEKFRYGFRGFGRITGPT